MFFLLTIHNGGTADLCYFLIMTVERPTTNFTVTQHIFEEQNTTREPQSKTVKQFHVTKKIVIGIPVVTKKKEREIYCVLKITFKTGKTYKLIQNTEG